MLKRLLLFVCVLSLGASFSFGNTTFVSSFSPFSFVGIMQQLKEHIEDSLAYEYSRGVMLQIATSFNDNDPYSGIVFSYKAPWGYKEGGNIKTPFKGINATCSIDISYDGISVNPLRSHTLQRLIATHCHELFNLPPHYECIGKITQLVISQALKPRHDAHYIKEQLTLLLTRYSLTPAAPPLHILNTTIGAHELKSFIKALPADYIDEAIEVCKQIIFACKKELSSTNLLSIIKNGITQLDYHSDYFTITLPLTTKQVVINLPFDYEESGAPNEPFSGIEVQVSIYPLEKTEKGEEIQIVEPDFAISFDLSSYSEGALRILSLLSSALLHSFSPHYVSKELHHLIKRLELTLENDEHSTSSLQATLKHICAHADTIMEYDFNKPFPPLLDTSQTLLFLLRLAYKTFINVITLHHSGHFQALAPTSSQKIEHFVATNLAFILKRSDIIHTIQTIIRELSGIAYLEKRFNTTIPTSLFWEKFLNDE